MLRAPFIVAHVPSPPFQVLFLSWISTLLSQRLHNCRVPLRCFSMCNHPPFRTKSSLLSLAPSTACNSSHNPSTLAKWVSLLSLDVPKSLTCLSHQSSLSRLSVVVPFKSKTLQPALQITLVPGSLPLLSFYSIYSLDLSLDPYYQWLL